MAQQEPKSPETVAEWAAWIRRAQDELAATAVPFDTLRPSGKALRPHPLHASEKKEIVE